MKDKRDEHGIQRLTIIEWQKAAYAQAKAKGWHAGPVDLWKAIALIHSEASEAIEEMRKKDFDPLRTYYRTDGKPEGLPSELADIVIRCLDTAEALGIDLEQAIEEKHAFNASRPHRHGGKLA